MSGSSESSDVSSDNETSGVFTGIIISDSISSVEEFIFNNEVAEPDSTY